MGRPKKATPQIDKAPPRLAGTLDLLPEHHSAWDFFVEKADSLGHTFGYSKITTPIVEDARLFHFWSDDSSSLVSFHLDKQTQMALKPTNIFSLIRAYLEHKFAEREKTTKWHYYTPIAHLNAKGEAEHTWEYGFQVLGHVAPITDAQLINLLLRLYTEIGLTNLSLELNNVGCIQCLPAYQDQLKQYFKDKKYDLCENCLEHWEQGQSLRILACPNLSCSTAAAEAPPIIDYLCENCRRHFISVLEGLDELGIAYNLNPKVIGSSWSRRTQFEIHFRAPNQEIILGRGGHADDLVQSLGGLPAHALNFCGTLRAFQESLQAANIRIASKNKVDVFLVPLGDLAAKKTLRLFTDLWNNQIVASEFSGPGSIKTQLKLAESNKVSIALIIGQKEARDGTVILRDVRSGMQELFTIERIVDEVKKRLGK